MGITVLADATQNIYLKLYLGYSRLILDDSRPSLCYDTEKHNKGPDQPPFPTGPWTCSMAP